MKLGVLSDLHVDVNRHMIPKESSFVEIVANKLMDENIDVLLLAGDISNDYRISLSFLEELEEKSKTKVLFVPGNHDYWSKENKVVDSWKIYEEYKAWHGCIAENPYHLNDEWVVIGNSGWYDHSFGSSSFTEEEFKKMHYMERTWQDSIYTDWGRENKEVHRFFYEKIEADLKKHSDKKIILMTHMLTHPCFIVPMPNEMWAYFNAFLGSAAYNKIYEQYHVRYGIMGHVHYRKLAYTEKTNMICACLGNHNEWRSKDLIKEINDAFYSFDISL